MGEPGGGERTSDARPRFATFDGLRALAAISVVAHHVGFDTGVTFRSRAGDFLARMDIGVSVFFAISGFLLFRPFVAALVEQRPAMRAGEFWKRRVLRIVPAYWLALTMVVVAFGETLHGWRDVVTFYGLLQIYDHDRFLGGLVQAWSLCTEISFYVFLPLYVAACRRVLGRRPPEQQLPVLLGGCAALYAVGVGWRVFLFGADPSFRDIGLFWLPGQIDHFAIGMGLAVLSVWAGRSAGLDERARRATRAAWPWWLGAGIAFWVVSVPLDVPKGLAPIPAGTDLARQALYGLVALGLLVPAVFERHGTGAVRRVLAHPVMWWLGVMSYGVYLWHKDLVPKVQLAFGWSNFEGNWFVVFGVVLAASVAIAAASWYLVEEPLLQRKERPERRRPTVWTGLAPARAAAPPEPARPDRGERRRFTRGLLVVTAVGLAIRVLYLWLSRRGIYACPPGELLGCAGDGYVYHAGANLIADGQGFVSPLGLLSGNRFPGADHPPLYWLYLAAWSWVGLDSYTWHQVATLVLGVASVPLAGLVGREVGGAERGRALGWAAAAAVAVYPFVWVNDGLVLSETITITTVLLTVLCAYRCWRRPTVGRVALLGVAGGLGALTRAEVVLLFPFVALPLLWRATGTDLRRRLTALAVVGATGAAVMAPWVVRNLRTFDEPVILSTGLGVTMAYSNCDRTYQGELLGFWWYECKGPVDLQADADQSVVDSRLRRQAVDYVEDHARRVPVVLAARFGRVWGLYKPNQVTYLDTLEDRPLWVNRLGLVAYYPTMALAAVGVVALRRRRVPVYPLLVPLGIVTFAVLLTFAQTRYRATAEGTIAVLAAAGALRVGEVVAPRWRAARGVVPAPASPAAPPAAQVAQPGPPSQP